jgi:hypothetical protein
MKRLINRLTTSERRARFVFSLVLRGLKMRLDRTANKHASFKERLKEKNFVAQIKLDDNYYGRH